MSDLTEQQSSQTVKITGADSTGVETNYAGVNANQELLVNSTSKNSDTAGQAQYNFPAGFVRVTDEPTQLFYDPFDSILDTNDRWSVPVSGGGGVPATVVSGSLTIGSGTTASGYSTLSSQATFTPTVPSWLGESHALKIEFPVTTNAYRFWGHGTIPAVPTTAAPLTDAYGFEIDTAGKLYAVIYTAGVRTQVADLSSSGTNSQPVDSIYHRYIVYYRTDKVFFYIDSLATPVATANFVSPAIQSLPHRFLSIAGATPPSPSAVINCTGVAVWDTGKNNQALSDGMFGWRKATVKAASTAAVATDTALVVAVSPNNNLVQEKNGNIQLVTDILYSLLAEMRAMRLAMVAIACEGGKYREDDFDPQSLDETSLS